MIYPNHVIDILHISVNDASDNGIIYNTSGVIVKKFILKKGMNTIDVNDLQSGIYVVNFTSEGQTISQKIIK